jgi:hypothetical protein
MPYPLTTPRGPGGSTKSDRHLITAGTRDASRPPAIAIVATALGYLQGALYLLLSLLLAAVLNLLVALPNVTSKSSVILVALIPFAMGGLFVLGALRLQKGRGRALLVTVCLLVAVVDIIGLVHPSTIPSHPIGITIGALALPIITAVLALLPPTTHWLDD